MVVKSLIVQLTRKPVISNARLQVPVQHFPLAMTSPPVFSFFGLLSVFSSSLCCWSFAITCWGTTLAPVRTQMPDDPPWTRSPPLFCASSFALVSLSLSASSGSQMWQLQFTHSIVVLRMTSRKGTTRQKISQMSIIFMSEVGAAPLSCW